MTNIPLPNRIYLQERLTYNWFTGVFRYKPIPVISNYDNGWNLRHAWRIPENKDRSDYLRISIDNKRYLAHRLAWVMLYNDDPGDLEIDHIDRDPANNRYWNLRLVDSSQNKLNRKTPIPKSGTIGIWYMKSCKRWQAYISIDKKRHDAFFVKKEDAIAWRKSMELIHYKGFFPNI